LHASTGYSFDVAIAELWGLRQHAGDVFAPGDWFDDAVMGRAAERESAVTHADSSKHKGAFLIEDF